MGAEHARLLSTVVAGGQVAAVFDVDATRASAVAADCGAHQYDDPMVLIKDEQVDAVLVASSDATHEQFVLASIAAGKPVLCEKPLAPDLDGCLRIVQAEAEHGSRLVSVGFMRRHDPGYLELKQAVVSGDIGAPVMMHCVHRNVASTADQQGATLITGSAVHEIDIVRWLLEEELTAVSVHVPRRATGADGRTRDPVFLILESASGVLIDVEVFVNAQYGYEVRCELVADAGTVLLDAPRPTVRRSAGQVARSVPADWRPRFADAYRIELQDWIDGVAVGDAGRGASSWDGYVATAVARAGVLALETGQRQPVELADKPALYR
jgi:myo-inositol 2-dehydrogenase/D-chiro-inositol 1-dehydrogenase